MVFGGTLTNGTGAELASGAQLAVGDKVRLHGGTVSAVLPSSILPFAYDSGMIPLGDGELPVRRGSRWRRPTRPRAYRADRAVHRRAHARGGDVVEPGRRGAFVDRRRRGGDSDVDVDRHRRRGAGAPGGGGEPAADPGRPRRGERAGHGSLYVEATLSGDLKLFLDCLQADQVGQGSSFADLLPGSLGVFGVPGWTGVVDGSRCPGGGRRRAVEPAAAAGAGGLAGLARRVSLRLRLTAAQRTAWLGSATSVPVSGAVVVHGAGSAEETQTVPSRAGHGAGRRPGDALAAAGHVDLDSPSDGGVALRSDRVISLDVTVGGVRRTLTLTRVTAGEPIRSRGC